MTLPTRTATHASEFRLPTRPHRRASEVSPSVSDPAERPHAIVPAAIAIVGSSNTPVDESSLNPLITEVLALMAEQYLVSKADHR
jgi:hypothetical protein